MTTEFAFYVLMYYAHTKSQPGRKIVHFMSLLDHFIFVVVVLELRKVRELEGKRRRRT